MRGKKIAVLVTVILCIFSLFFGSARSIIRLKNEAYDYFRNPINGSTVSLRQDLYERAGFTANLIDLYRKCLPDNIDETKELARIISELQSDSLMPDKASKLNNELTIEFDKLAEKLKNSNIGDNDTRLLNKVSADVKATQDIIVRSPYNKKAEEINGKINSFPVTIFKTLMFIGDVEYFEN